jgi:hypothetical protein
VLSPPSHAGHDIFSPCEQDKVESAVYVSTCEGESSVLSPIKQDDNIREDDLEYQSDDYDEDDDDDEFALDLGGGARGWVCDDFGGKAAGGSLALVSLKESAVGVGGNARATAEIGGKRNQVNVSSFFMGGVDESGGVDDSFLSTEGVEICSCSSPGAALVSANKHIDGDDNGDDDDGWNCSNKVVIDGRTGDDDKVEPPALPLPVEKSAASRDSEYFGSYRPFSGSEEVQAEEAFFWGWISCTSRLVHNTPKAFTTALDNLEDWATAATKAQLQEQSQRQQVREEGTSEDNELDRSNHNWGNVSREGMSVVGVDEKQDRVETAVEEDIHTGLASGASDDGDSDVSSAAELSYHEESSRRLSRGLSTGDKDEDSVDSADDLLGEMRGAPRHTPRQITSAAATAWGKRIGAGITALAQMVSHYPKW